MGRAPDGDPAHLRAAVARLLDAEGPWYRYRAAPSPALLGFDARGAEGVLEGPWADFAAAAQEALEGAITRVAASALAETGAPLLCLGGGVTLNCSANGRLLASGTAPALQLFPATGDGGLAVGAALLAAADAGEPRTGPIAHASWGPEFGEATCEAALAAATGVRWRRLEDPAAQAAERLAAGEVIGWFQGRMELGPRALGNRSILADPRSAATRDRVNRIKHREPWRPLAPMVPLARAAEFFELVGESPFMLQAVQVRADARARIPAVVHVDGSARPQTVRPEQNPRLHALLEAFGARTGVPVLLDTSFNDADEPIVCTPEDAIRTLLSTGLDALVMGDFEVRGREEGA
jgi:carbamoyltransferase